MIDKAMSILIVNNKKSIFVILFLNLLRYSKIPKKNLKISKNIQKISKNI